MVIGIIINNTVASFRLSFTGLTQIHYRIGIGIETLIYVGFNDFKMGNGTPYLSSQILCHTLIRIINIACCPLLLISN